jgi:EGF-like domain
MGWVVQQRNDSVHLSLQLEPMMLRLAECTIVLLCFADNLCAATTPCKNDGTCAPSGGTYACTCPRGFGGKSCEISKMNSFIGGHYHSLCRLLDKRYEVRKQTFVSAVTIFDQVSQDTIKKQTLVLYAMAISWLYNERWSIHIFLYFKPVILKWESHSMDVFETTLKQTMLVVYSMSYVIWDVEWRCLR